MNNYIIPKMPLLSRKDEQQLARKLEDIEIQASDCLYEASYLYSTFHNLVLKVAKFEKLSEKEKHIKRITKTGYVTLENYFLMPFIRENDSRFEEKVNGKKEEFEQLILQQDLAKDYTRHWKLRRTGIIKLKNIVQAEYLHIKREIEAIFSNGESIDYKFIEEEMLWKDVFSEKDYVKSIKVRYNINGESNEEAKRKIIQENTNLINNWKRYQLLEKKMDYIFNKFVSSNLRLVAKISNRYKNKGLDMEDIIQEGNMGLIKSVELFNYRKDTKFSTFATWWIRQSITRAIADKKRNVRIPIHAQEKMAKINNARSYFLGMNKREPTIEELSKISEIDQKSIHFLIGINKNELTLNEPYNNSKREKIDFLPDNRYNPENEALKMINQIGLKKVLGEMLDKFPERERDVIYKRFGIGCKRQYSLEEVSRYYDLTKERIRQIEGDVLKRLRHPKRRLILEEFID
jgi:RNA polymerase sigma factor (sigma-70 family)